MRTARYKCRRLCHGNFGPAKKLVRGTNILGEMVRPSLFFSENIGPNAKILVRLAMVNGKPATIVYSGVVVSF